MISDPKLPFANDSSSVGELESPAETAVPLVPGASAGFQCYRARAFGCPGLAAPHRSASVRVFVRDARGDADDSCPGGRSGPTTLCSCRIPCSAMWSPAASCAVWRRAWACSTCGSGSGRRFNIGKRNEEQSLVDGRSSLANRGGEQRPFALRDWYWQFLKEKRPTTSD